MKKRVKKREQWTLSYKPLLGYSLMLICTAVLAFAVGGVILSVNRMRERTNASVNQLQDQIGYRVGQTIKLLESQAAKAWYLDPAVPAAEKIEELEQLNEHFGYMMLLYVDEDKNVHSSRGLTSLASRDYIQRLFATGKFQVTDSIIAGADGKTLNYTVAVPLLEGREVKGCLFGAIYFDEIEQYMKQGDGLPGVDAVLLGSQGQIMSATTGQNYGDSYIAYLSENKLWNTTAARIEEDLLARKSFSLWSMVRGDICYTSIEPVANTGWNIVCATRFADVYRSEMSALLPAILFSILILMLVSFLVWRYLVSQLKVVDALVQSVQQLEQKIYQSERPDNVAFNDIIHLTSTGLSDGLTGVPTRTVFMNRLRPMVKQIDAKKIVVLCFVDLDDLKKLNDTYGHEAGDKGLKNVGYVLRDYESKYEGMVGRYGGDEFVLLMSDIDSEEELREIMDELTLRLQSTINHGGELIHIRCSVGVSIWDRTSDTDKLLKEADEALYFVKQNGKGYYKIYQDAVR